MRYESEKEIKDLLTAFESATIGRDEWKHAQHLVVALCYVSSSDLLTATEKMRSGIFKLLTDAFGVDLTEEMPYHETLTIFWMKTVNRFNANRKGRELVAKANDLVAEFDKDYPMKFYSCELLWSDLARTTFVEPDLHPF